MTLPKPYYEDTQAGITIYHADMRDILPSLDDRSVDIIWTDPPYGHKNNDGDLIHQWEKALGRPHDCESSPRPIANDDMDSMRSEVDFMLSEASRILKKDCCCCCCCGGGGPKPTFSWVAKRMDEKGLSFFHAVVWDKGGLGMGWRYRRNYEFVMVSHRRGGKLKWEWDGSGLETANIVRIGKIIPRKDDHPTPKPVELIEHFLRLHGKRGDTVLDPFAGALPVAEACKKMGMRYIGIEIDKQWIDLGLKRLAQEVLNLGAA